MTTSSFLNMYSFLMYWCCNRSFWWAFPFIETSAVWKVKCCIWRRCPSLYFKTKWRFTKTDRLQDNLISLISFATSVHVIISVCWHKHRLVFCHECWIFIGVIGDCLVNYTIHPIDFKYFFISLSYSILMCR